MHRPESGHELGARPEGELEIPSTLIAFGVV